MKVSLSEWMSDGIRLADGHLGDCPRMGFPENRVLKINNLQHKIS